MKIDDGMIYFFEIFDFLARGGPGDNESTGRAFQMIKDPPAGARILDVGCGPGMQTIELARLSKGRIMALDNHQPFLDKLEEDARALGLSPYIETLNQDMNTMNFKTESFDIIWAEGALNLMGFENGLRACRPMLRRTGHLAVTELVWLNDLPSAEAREWAKEYPSIQNVPDNLELFKNCGYEVIGHFTLPVSSWFVNYYDPMQERLHELKKKYQGLAAAMEVINSAQAEITGFRKCSGDVGYEFFVARRSS